MEGRHILWNPNTLLCLIDTAIPLLLTYWKRYRDNNINKGNVSNVFIITFFSINLFTYLVILMDS